MIVDHFLSEKSKEDWCCDNAIRNCGWFRKLWHGRKGCFAIQPDHEGESKEPVAWNRCKKDCQDKYRNYDCNKLIGQNCLENRKFL